MAVISMRQMLEAGAHFGHQTRRWNPKMKRFIFGERAGIYIIDLEQTLGRVETAYGYVRDLVAGGGNILFVGTKKQAQDVLTTEAARAGQFYVCSRWLGGTLTNWQTLRQSIDKLRNIERMAADGTTGMLTKKEALMLDRKRIKLERNLGGIKDMNKLPGALFVIDPVREHIAVTEANRLNIPVIAIADTNADPNSIQIVVPGNDDAIRSIKLFCSRIAEACIEGSRMGKARAVSDVVEQEAPETIRVHTGGDGPKVEIVSRRTQLPAPEAAATPEEGPLGVAPPTPGE